MNRDEFWNWSGKGWRNGILRDRPTTQGVGENMTLLSISEKDSR